jgi:hypothetical protein
VSATMPRATSFAALSMYLYTSDGSYCGQNLPDLPTWRGLLPAGQKLEVDISGFQVFRAQCQVTSIRAILHSRTDLNVGIPPSPSEILAETTIPVSYTLQNTP